MADEPKEASPEERKKIVELLEAGKVETSDLAKRAFAGMAPTMGDPERKPDWTVVEAQIDGAWGPWEDNKGGICIQWGTVSAGFGQVAILLGNDGKAKLMTEHLSKEFVFTVLRKLVEDAEIID